MGHMQAKASRIHGTNWTSRNQSEEIDFLFIYGFISETRGVKSVKPARKQFTEKPFGGHKLPASPMLAAAIATQRKVHGENQSSER